MSDNLTVRCPACRADIGKPCLKVNGAEAKQVHPERSQRRLLFDVYQQELDDRINVGGAGVLARAAHLIPRELSGLKVETRYEHPEVVMVLDGTELRTRVY